MQVSFKKIGRVIHYYDKIGVAVLDLTESLKVGDRIKLTRGGEDLFEQTITSLQVNHKSVDVAHPGDDIALKTNNKAKESSEIFKIE